jgi:Skp family chaperone for outer membrane proteins
MMKRALVFAAAAFCFTAAAHAQGKASKKYDWDSSSSQSCMEPYAPAVPKAEETTLQELIEDVKPEVRAFIDDSNKYLECLGVQLAKAREERDEAKIKKLVKAHNDNVQYQQSVAGEFNETLEALKEQAGLSLKQTGGAKDGKEEAPAGSAASKPEEKGAEAAEPDEQAEGADN